MFGHVFDQPALRRQLSDETVQRLVALMMFVLLVSAPIWAPFLAGKKVGQHFRRWRERLAEAADDVCWPF
jgi:hypothetical protein